ncbi:MAG: glycoside hydrolase family 28 protein [Prolixibacteraceae bacterium]|jgi:polygalacturonase
MNLKNVLVVALVSLFSTTYAQTNWNQAEKIVSQLNPVTFPNKEYRITDFGAVGDNKTPCKEAFDKAVTVCSENGGGTIIVDPGNYYMNGPLVFKSNVNIELKEGTTLNFSTNENDYLPAVLTRWEGTELYNYSPLIYAYHVNNIALTGMGTINGNGARKFAPWNNIQTTEQEMLRKMGRETLPVYRRVFGKGFKLRPGFFEPFGCTNVRIEGITILDSPFWVIHPIFCNNVIVRGVNVNSHNYNNDGCDPESCTNVLIEDCTFSTGDDAIAIKSGRDNDAWRVGLPTENVVIRNCSFRSKINGVCIGSEIAGGVRNIFIENIKIPKSSNAIYFKSNLDRGGYIENIYVRNIQADTVRTALIRFEPNYKGERSSFHPTRFNSFVIEDVSCKQSGECGIYMSGFDGFPITNITMRNIKIGNTPVPYCLKNGKDILFDKVMVNGNLLDRKPLEIGLIKLNVL